MLQYIPDYTYHYQINPMAIVYPTLSMKTLLDERNWKTIGMPLNPDEVFDTRTQNIYGGFIEGKHFRFVPIL